VTPNFTNLALSEEVIGGDELDTILLRQMDQAAKSFLISFDWCNGVRRSYFGDGVGGIIAAYLIEISPARSGIDEWLWVVVGDVPPAYLVTDEIEDAAKAIQVYVELMREWIDAVERGLPVDSLIPVNAPPTQETAISLKTRLNTIDLLGLYPLSTEVRHP
jgi:hypothetical protein